MKMVLNNNIYFGVIKPNNYGNPKYHTYKFTSMSGKESKDEKSSW